MSEPEEQPTGRQGFLVTYFGNPVVVISMSILAAIFVLIGSAIFGFDRGAVLRAMSEITFARGLITYLFATVTVGTAMVIVVSGLTTGNDEKHDRQFQRGKEILSLLLGVFGTIVGFYFGSEVGAKGSVEERPLQVASLRISKSDLIAGEKFSLMTIVSGGRGPFRYGASVGDQAPSPSEAPDPSGWITKDLEAPTVLSQQTLTVRVIVKDIDDHGSEQTARIVVKPAPP